MEEFTIFLNKLLKERKIDANVYSSYLLSILEDVTLDEEERRETVSDILGDLIENDTDSLVNEILNKWSDSRAAPKKTAAEKQEAVDIAELMVKQANISIQASGGPRNRQLTEEEKRIKEQILASYSQTDEPEDEEEDCGSQEEDDPNLEKNTNKSDVQKLAREKREQAKLDSEQKKLKDKEDRAKQKASREDKKKNRQSAAVKGERRR